MALSIQVKTKTVQTRLEENANFLDCTNCGEKLYRYIGPLPYEIRAYNFQSVDARVPEPHSGEDFACPLCNTFLEYELS